jgi:TonB family protein
MFGAGVTLNVTGRVSRPLGGDWYAISWNNQTAFVRQQDAVAGQGAPPVAAEHPAQTEEEIKKPEDVETPDAEDDGVFSPPPPPPSEDFDLSNVDWIRAPSARDFARFYPHRALDQGRSGRVVLDCIAAPNGMLDCSVAQENPPGAGFGEAALNISRQVRIQPTLPDGRSVAGGHLRLPLTFRAD